MRRRGFTLIEMAVVIAVLAVILAIGLGALGRYRRNTALNQAVETLLAEIQNSQAQARAFGLPQSRSTWPASSGQNTSSPTVLRGRVVEKRKGQQPHVIKEWIIGDVGGTGLALSLVSENLYRSPMTNLANDEGYCVEIAGSSTLASVMFQPDGRIYNMDNRVSSYIYLANADHQYAIELSPLGKAVQRRTR